MIIKLALLGFGNVGRGFTRLLLDKKDFLKKHFDAEYQVVSIYDIHSGGILSPDKAIDLEKILAIVESGGMIADYPGATNDLNSLGVIEKSGADVLVEMTYTDLESGQPAVSHCQQALSNGMHVVTSNKGPAAFARKDLWQLAEEHGAHFRFEGAIMSGTPVISLITGSMSGAEVLGFRGIVNGTCNYILSRMEGGASYDEALKEAQAKGIAEAEPSADVDGLDAAAKGVILANTVMGTDFTLSQVRREGISKLTEEDISEALKENRKWRLVVECKNNDGEISLTVGPIKVNLDDPLASVIGTENALTITTDVLGDVTISGRGAGRLETGFAILSDLLWIQQRLTGKSY